MTTTPRPGGAFLLPGICRSIGLALLAPGLIFVYLFAYEGIKPAFLDVHVPALWAQYFETRYWTVIENNIAEEITLFTLLASMFLIASARVADENEATILLRFKALMLATYINTAFLIFAIVFVYGIAFATIVFINLFSGLASFILIFYASYYRYRTKRADAGDD
jgi:hypothetical protein